MSNYLSKVQNSHSSTETVMDLLFAEHHAFLQTIRVTRIVNRLILFGLIVLHIVYAAPFLRRIIAFILTGLLVSIFWIIQEFSTRRRVNRLGELIVKSVSAQYSRTDYKSFEENEEARVANIWVDTYINWRHEHWRVSRFEAIQRLEPVAWLILLLSLCLTQMLFR